MSSGFVHLCGLCWGWLRPDDDVVAAERTRSAHDAGDARRATVGHREWFHRSCYGTGLPGFREQGRGKFRDLAAD